MFENGLKMSVAQLLIREHNSGLMKNAIISQPSTADGCVKTHN